MNLSRELAQDKGGVSTVYTNNEVDSVTDSVSGKEGNLLRMFSGMSGMELEAGEWPVDWGGRKAGAGALEAGDCWKAGAGAGRLLVWGWKAGARLLEAWEGWKAGAGRLEVWGGRMAGAGAGLPGAWEGRNPVLNSSPEFTSRSDWVRLR